MIGAVLANGVRWVHTVGGTGIGDTVAVFGPGPQGLAAVIAAHAAGAERIIVVGLAADRARLDFARDCGATHTLSFDQHTVEAIGDLTGGRLADVVIDVTGSEKSPPVAAETVRPLGTFVMAGSTAAATVRLPWNELVRRKSVRRASTATIRPPSAPPSPWPPPGAIPSTAWSPTASPSHPPPTPGSDPQRRRQRRRNQGRDRPTRSGRLTTNPPGTSPPAR